MIEQLAALVFMVASRAARSHDGIIIPRATACERSPIFRFRLTSYIVAVLVRDPALGDRP